jgi:hypothetical protein
MTPAPFDKELLEAIQDLIKRGELDEGAPAYGTALQVIHGGYASLTRMQRALYDRVVTPALERRSRDLASAQPADRPGSAPPSTT